jgi:hypothetical protein
MSKLSVHQNISPSYPPMPQTFIALTHRYLATRNSFSPILYILLYNPTFTESHYSQPIQISNPIIQNFLQNKGQKMLNSKPSYLGHIDTWCFETTFRPPYTLSSTFQSSQNLTTAKPSKYLTVIDRHAPNI